jgi:STE24 endopeptidase
MVQVLMILLFGSIYVHDGQGDAVVSIGPDPLGYPFRVAGITLAGFYVIWGAFHLLARFCGAQVDRTGRMRWIQLAERGMTAARLLGAAWWVFALFELGWLRAVRTTIGDLLLVDELLAMSPFIALLAGAWWSIYPVERRFHDALLVRQLDDPHGHTIHPPLTRGQHVWMSMRHQVMLWMVPLTLLMGWQEFLNFEIEPIVRLLQRIAPGRIETLLPLVQWVGTLAIVITAPSVMRVVWDTVRIESGPLADQVHAMCRKYKVRVAGPLLWRTRGSMVNGAILGVFWPFRFMLLTDALIERLSPSQVEAVMAHEVAHVRRRHLIWLAVCVLSTVLVAAWAIAGAVGALQFLTSIKPSDDMVSIAATVIGLGGAGLVFGVVSRRFEWQADAFAVQHLSQKEAGSEERRGEALVTTPGLSSLPSVPVSAPRVTREAVVVMASALQAVADLNGIAANKFSWRHGSIRQRQERLMRLVDVPVAAAPIDRQVRVIKVVAGVALALGVASMVLQEALMRSSIVH